MNIRGSGIQMGIYWNDDEPDRIQTKRVPVFLLLSRGRMDALFCMPDE
jgi:hypothetical protein